MKRRPLVSLLVVVGLLLAAVLVALSRSRSRAEERWAEVTAVLEEVLAGGDSGSSEEELPCSPRRRSSSWFGMVETVEQDWYLGDGGYYSPGSMLSLTMTRRVLVTDLRARVHPGPDGLRGVAKVVEQLTRRLTKLGVELEAPHQHTPVSWEPGRGDEEDVLLAAARYLYELTPGDEHYPYLWRKSRGLVLPKETYADDVRWAGAGVAHHLSEEDLLPPAFAERFIQQLEAETKPALELPSTAASLGRDVHLVSECSHLRGTRGWFDPARPFFSDDGRWALVVGWVGPGSSYHGLAGGGVLLKRVDGRWEVLAARFVYAM